MASRDITINRVQAVDLLDMMQHKIEQMHAIAFAATTSRAVPESTLRLMFDVVQTIAEDATTEYHALGAILADPELM
jgi:hypothetical protein